MKSKKVWVTLCLFAASVSWASDPRLMMNDTAYTFAQMYPGIGISAQGQIADQCIEGKLDAVPIESPRPQFYLWARESSGSSPLLELGARLVRLRKLMTQVKLTTELKPGTPEFINKCGTHFVSGLLLGAKISHEASLRTFPVSLVSQDDLEAALIQLQSLKGTQIEMVGLGAEDRSRLQQTWLLLLNSFVKARLLSGGGESYTHVEPEFLNTLNQCAQTNSLPECHQRWLDTFQAGQYQDHFVEIELTPYSKIY